MTDDEKVDKLIDVLMDKTKICEICSKIEYERKFSEFPPVSFQCTINNHLFCQECAYKIYHMTQNRMYITSFFESIISNMNFVPEGKRSLFYYVQLVNGFKNVQNMIQHMKKINELTIEQKMLSLNPPMSFQL